MSEKQKVAAIGEMLWDVYGDKKYVGGAPANFASHVVFAGCRAFLLSRVGDDDNGRELIEKLMARNVDVSGVQTDIFKPTGQIKVKIDAKGQPSFQCARNVAFDDMRMDSVWENLAPQMDVVFFDMLAQRAEVSREAIHSFLGKASKALKVFDANIHGWDAATERVVLESLNKADMLKLNRDECTILKNGLSGEEDDVEFLQSLVHRHDLKMAALTLGDVGCYIVTPDQKEFDPGYYISVVDAAGAGDAFAAGMVVKYLQGADLAEIADFANRLAAFVSTRQGASPAWTFEELEKEMALSL